MKLNLGLIYLAAVVIGTAFFTPVGLFLQWWLPQDGPAELFVFALSVPLLLASASLYLLAFKSLRKTKFASFALLSFFIWIQIFTFVPQISRRIGPWKDLRGILKQSVSEATRARDRLGLPANRPLTADEMKLLTGYVRFSRPEYVFPFLKKRVKVRWISSAYPYLGLNYGEGRNCLFDLESMHCIYAD
jgi:hypothetical protein